MDRRTFLSRLLIGSVATAAVAAVDPEALLWTPSKTFFIPPPSGWTPGGIPFSFDAWVPTISLAEYEKIFKPAAKALADKIDADAMACFKSGRTAMLLQQQPIVISQKFQDAITASMKDMFNPATIRKINELYYGPLSKDPERWTVDRS